MSVTFPHCDARVLHAPGECEVCDQAPDLQEARKAWGIAFSGHARPEGGLPCPADAARPAGTERDHQRWWGNRAVVPAAKPAAVAPVVGGLTTDRNDPRLGVVRADGQQEAYVVLSEAERAEGFVLPVRRSYIHLACGALTRMGQAIAETYARDPSFYGATFCVGCRDQFRLREEHGWAFRWDEPVPGSEYVGQHEGQG